MTPEDRLWAERLRNFKGLRIVYEMSKDAQSQHEFVVWASLKIQRATDVIARYGFGGGLQRVITE